MIPPDVANNLRLLLPDSAKLTAELPQNQPVAATQRITDVLSDLQPGQRLMAEVQALLPNGTYRAVVGQRDVTLSLPFAAKAGDSLELEVVESDGKVTLAFVANRTAQAEAAMPQESVATRLSQTGKLIGDLLAGLDHQGKRAPPAPLNGSQPLVEAMPATGADLAPVLKQALTRSGMFYEAHQARWVAGELPTRQLLQEPQGRYSPLQVNLAAEVDAAGAPSSSPHALAAPQVTGEAAQASPPPATGDVTVNDLPMADRPGRTADSAQGTPVNANTAAAQTAASAPHGQPAGIPPDLTPLVQQQLDALATQTFAWQGQIWPGQQMFWEIDQQSESRRGATPDEMGQWQTRLKVTLPRLGGIAATLRLRANHDVEIELSTDNLASEAMMTAAAADLQQQFDSAALRLTQVNIKHVSPEE